MKKILISKIRKEFFELKNTKEDCQEYIKVALEENGFKEVKKGEIISCLDGFSQNAEQIMSIIKEQEKIIERKSMYLTLPKFFINSIRVKRKTRNMKKSFVEYVQKKSKYTFEEYTNKHN